MGRFTWIITIGKVHFYLDEISIVYSMVYVLFFLGESTKKHTIERLF